ncbi:MAG TPA: carboxymuconolactone decarboxylase family protein [Bdellovibrionales bacterium]|nr:carboxymuconolactone decarboxylase family protein [Bdellovibrionales bacterium]
MNPRFFENLESLYRGPDTPASRDLKLNLQRLLNDGALGPEDGLLAFLAASRAVESKPLEEIARSELAGLGLSDEAIQEAAQSAAIMAMLNTYYRFKHMIGNTTDYTSTGLRMNALAKPVLGKERYELLAFTVSVLNGCETCIRAHEKVLRDGGMETAKIHDAARLAAVVKAYKTLVS